jgi:VCBS repeat protein
MIRTFHLCLLAVVFSLLPTYEAAGQASDDALAMQFYPSALDDIYTANHAPGGDIPRHVTILRLDLAHTGNTDFIAVAYSNGKAARLKVIQTTGTPHVVGESQDTTMGGAGRPVLEAVDIDNDGIPEIAVHFHRATWLYKFKNNALVLFGPSLQGTTCTTTNLGDTYFADIDGDGILEILEEAHGASDLTYIVHKLDQNGVFQKTSGGAAFFSGFERGDGNPTTEELTFAAVAGANYLLRIVNGDQKKAGTVTSADVRLNGVLVAGPNDFKGTPRTLALPVKLLASNTIDVTLRSDPGTVITITVTRGE